MKNGPRPPVASQQSGSHWAKIANIYHCVKYWTQSVLLFHVDGKLLGPYFSYKHAVGVLLFAYPYLFFVPPFAKEQEKQRSFNSGLRRVLDETSVQWKDEVREERRPAWERHPGEEGVGGRCVAGT